MSEKEWVAKIRSTLKLVHNIEYEKIASQTLWGIRLIILIKPEHTNKIAHIQGSQVRTGIGNALGEINWFSMTCFELFFHERPPLSHAPSLSPFSLPPSSLLLPSPSLPPFLSPPPPPPICLSLLLYLPCFFLLPSPSPLSLSLSPLSPLSPFFFLSSLSAPLCVCVCVCVWWFDCR